MKDAQNFIITFLVSSRKPALYASIAACLFVGAIHVPVLNIPVLFATYPLFWVVPEFSKSGHHVDVWFFGIMLKSPTAFLGFFTYYFLVSYLFQMIFKEENYENIDKASTTVASILFFGIVLLAIVAVTIST